MLRNAIVGAMYSLLASIQTTILSPLFRPEGPKGLNNRSVMVRSRQIAEQSGVYTLFTQGNRAHFRTY